jgi:hypothetical protein
MRLVFKFFLFFNFLFGFVGAIDLIDYTKYVSYINSRFDSFDKDKLKKILKIWEKLGRFKCNYYVYQDYVKISPVCFVKKEFPQIDFKKSIDDIWSYIKDFSKSYDLKTISFIYT